MAYNNKFNNVLTRQQQAAQDAEYKRVLRNAGFDERMSKYRIAEEMKDEFLKSKRINPYQVQQGFAFEGVQGELVEADSNYAVAIDTLGLMNYIPSIERAQQVRGHIGYDQEGRPVSLRETFAWLDDYQKRNA
jgi:hypothetical protein